ncbi:EcsC family protein [Priestia taiwanensis]|uniref:EcsC protein family protein n=1 Tax=Priestia taiwanensis TaxID=1347902 RepID=A0A917EQV1_9BACI|nr:EcsC family protein [Priestia taiwanensis]MBM7363445.1 hypothetical protein [Priestia taiwanensis]GGE77080.1 hypothetical protein GCM10007140_28460 [Priestia taiwanensis]
MELTTREQKIWNDILEWQNTLANKDANVVQRQLDKWVEEVFKTIPTKKQHSFFRHLDGWLFHLHAFIQQSQVQIDAKNRILLYARTFDETVEEIEDMSGLSIDVRAYMVDQMLAKHRLYSFVQGGVAGTGGILFLGMDIPTMATINLRAVQLVAMTYGYDVNKPYEMMMALRVFHAALLPGHLQQYAWDQLVQDVQPGERPFFYEGNEELTNEKWLEQPMKQLLKMLAIYALRRKVWQGIPLLGIAIGSTANYKLTRHVTDFANRFYQFRALADKMN